MVSCEQFSFGAVNCGGPLGYGRRCAGEAVCQRIINTPVSLNTPASYFSQICNNCP